MSKNFVLDDGQQFILTEALASSQTSFATPELNTYIKATLYLLNKYDGSVKELNLVNREFTSNLDAFPLLDSVDNVGLKINGSLPEISRGSITVNNRPSTFGSERRFSDLLERYTIIEQPIKIWIAQIALNNDNVQDSDFELVWTAIVTNLNFDKEKIRIAISRSEIPVQLMTYNVNLDQFPDAPSESLGKHLPIILTSGSETIQVDAIRTTSENYAYDSNTTACDWVYATTLAQHKVDRIYSGTSEDQHLLMFNRSNKWQRMNPLRKNFFFLGDDFEINFHELNPYSYNGTWDSALKEIGYKLTPGQNCEAGQVIVGVDWFLSTSITGNFYNFQPAKFKLNVYSEWNNYPDQLIASDTIDCEVDNATRMELQSNIGSATYIYKFKFWLNKAIIIPENSSVFIVLERNDISDTYPSGVFGPVQTNNNLNGTAIDSFEQYYKMDSNGFITIQNNYNAELSEATKALLDKSVGIDQAYIDALKGRIDTALTAIKPKFEGWQLQAISAGKDHFKIYGLAVIDEASYATEYQAGLGFQGFKLIMPSQDQPDLTELRLLVNATGLHDDLDGTITGTPGAMLTTPVQQIRALMREWNGTNWIDKRFDHNKFSSTHSEYMTGRWGIRFGGATTGRAFLRDILSKITSDTMTVLVPYVSETDYSLGLFCWGTKGEIVANISDENGMFLDASISGIETVVNRVQFVYQRSLINRTEEILAEGGYKQFQSYLDSETLYLDCGEDDINRSQDRYGVRNLGIISRDWIVDDDSAKGIAGLVLRRYLEPEMLIRIAIPYYNAPDLEGMDVVRIHFANLPAYYGTAQDAKLPLAGTDNKRVDLVSGHYWKRAQKYRCAVLGNEIVLRNNEPVARVLTLLRLTKEMIL